MMKGYDFVVVVIEESKCVQCKEKGVLLLMKKIDEKIDLKLSSICENIHRQQSLLPRQTQSFHK